MNKLLSAILAGIFATTLSMGAFAANEASTVKTDATASAQKPAASVKKAKHHHHKEEKKEAAETTK